MLKIKMLSEIKEFFKNPKTCSLLDIEPVFYLTMPDTLLNKFRRYVGKGP